MTSSEPLVSIIIPAYNSAAHLSSAIDSALAQTYPNIEVVVVDDGSTDDTAQVLQRFAGMILCVSQSNAGLSAARNAGILASHGDYLVFLDADDRLLPRMVEQLLPALLDRPGCALAYGGYHQVDADGEKFGESSLERPSGRLFEMLASDGLFVVGTAMLRRSALARSGLFDPMLPQIEDRDLWIRLAYYYDFAFVPAHVSEYRSTPDSMSRNWPERQRASGLVVGKFGLFVRAKDQPKALLRAFRRSIYGHHPNQCIQDAFVHYWAGRHALAARKSFEGILVSPRFLANRGVVSVLVRSCLQCLRLGRKGVVK